MSDSKTEIDPKTNLPFSMQNLENTTKSTYVNNSSDKEVKESLVSIVTSGTDSTTGINVATITTKPQGSVDSEANK